MDVASVEVTHGVREIGGLGHFYVKQEERKISEKRAGRGEDILRLR